jgi:hypothetical protein
VLAIDSKSRRSSKQGLCPIAGKRLDYRDISEFLLCPQISFLKSRTGLENRLRMDCGPNAGAYVGRAFWVSERVGSDALEDNQSILLDEKAYT